jgi:hypothetical protein
MHWQKLIIDLGLYRIFVDAKAIFTYLLSAEPNSLERNRFCTSAKGYQNKIKTL